MRSSSVKRKRYVVFEAIHLKSQNRDPLPGDVPIGLEFVRNEHAIDLAVITTLA